MLIIIINLTILFNISGSLGCGIGYGYLHRIPIRLLPDEQKPLIGLSQKPLTEPTIPYVPPLANTFTQSGPAVGTEAPAVEPAVVRLSDAEIIAGVSNVSLNAGEQQPLINLGPADIPTSSAPAALQTETGQQPAAQQPSAVHHIFGTIPPTSVASLNESFGIQAGGPINSYYQPTVSTNDQGKILDILEPSGRYRFSLIHTIN